MRLPSRPLLPAPCAAAAALGAAAVLVPGGPVAAAPALAPGFPRWRPALARLAPAVPVSLAPPAGGAPALARRFAPLARL
ncbi:deoxyribonuclease IV, partial [Mycobacterium tuberculosis]